MRDEGDNLSKRTVEFVGSIMMGPFLGLLLLVSLLCL